jgi:proteasome component ECM29
MSTETGQPPGDELANLENVFFRIASANSDEELTTAVNRFLPGIILKLASTEAGVRKKILEMLVHVNKRIKSNDNIMLPMNALLVQYQVGLRLDKSYSVT